MTWRRKSADKFDESKHPRADDGKFGPGGAGGGEGKLVPKEDKPASGDSSNGNEPVGDDEALDADAESALEDSQQAETDELTDKHDAEETALDEKHAEEDEKTGFDDMDHEDQAAAIGRHDDEKDALAERHEVERNALSERHEAEIAAKEKIVERHEAETEKLTEKHEAETEKLEAVHEKERDKLEARQEKENDKFEQFWEKDSERIDAAREKEDAKIEATRDKEDEKLEADRDKEYENISNGRDPNDTRPETLAKEEAEDDALRAAGDIEDDEIGEKRDKEDAELAAARDKEDEEWVKNKEAKELELGKRFEDEQNALEQKHEAAASQLAGEQAKQAKALRQRQRADLHQHAKRETGTKSYRWPVKSAQFNETDHPRASDGKFGSGGGAGGGKGKLSKPADAKHGHLAAGVTKAKAAFAKAKQAHSAVTGYLDRNTNMPGVKQAKQAVGAALGAVKATQGKLYGVMEKRYGKNGAKAIFVAAQLIGSNPAVMPPWFVAIPGSTILAQLPLMGLAEVGLQTYRAGSAIGRAFTKSNGLSEEQIQAEAKKVLIEMYQTYLDELEKDKDVLRKAFAKFEDTTETKRWETKSAEFNESDHPRAADGKFGTGGNGGGAGKLAAKEEGKELAKESPSIPNNRRVELILQEASKIKVVDDIPDDGEGDLDTWYQDMDGDDSLNFETASGRKYKVFSTAKTIGGMSVPDIQFSDDSGNYTVTGGGEAFQVFSKAVPSVVSYIKNKNLGAAMFSAAEPSRQKLYDRLVRTAVSVMPGYFAASIDKVGKNSTKRYYFIGKNSKKEKLLAAVKNKIGGDIRDFTETRSFVASDESGWNELDADIDPSWFTPEGWESKDDQDEDSN